MSDDLRLDAPDELAAHLADSGDVPDFRSRVLTAFAKGRISCDCAGITHDATCPLGDLEVEADHIWRASLGIE